MSAILKAAGSGLWRGTWGVRALTIPASMRTAILAATADLARDSREATIATTNPRHLVLFVQAALLKDID